jgi:hypothetical protein
LNTEVAKDVTMDHHMSGKFTSECGYFSQFLRIFFLFFYFHNIWVYLLITLCTCIALLVVVMEYHVYIIRAVRVTIMSWYAIICFILLILTFESFSVTLFLSAVAWS